MKKQFNTLFSSLSASERANLTMQIEETLAGNFTPPRQKTFTAAELWSIQRQRKSMMQRRFIL